MDGFQDHYLYLGVDPDASEDQIRVAFRAKLLEIHPDKSVHPRDPEEMRTLLEAYEVLTGADSRTAYDKIWKVISPLDPNHISAIPHVTESERPTAKARSVLFLLLEERGEEALERIGDLQPGGRLFLRQHLSTDEFVDACFLIGELLETQKKWVMALEWYEDLIRVEESRNHHRPCYPEARDRARRLLLKRTSAQLEPRIMLEYLRRAEILGLDKMGRTEVAKKRAQCYLQMDMKVEASRHLEEVLRLQPRARGLDRIREALDGYMDE
ncbi:MAG: J domain-containing protein [Planctomycetota bacterium]